MTISVEKKDNDAFAYLLSDQSSNARLIRVAALSDFQIGLPEEPAELQLTGRITVSSLTYDIKPREIFSVPSHVTFLSLRIEKTLRQSTQSTVILPQGARQGQIFYVKDDLGYSDICQILLSQTGTDVIRILNYKFGCIGFIWTGTYWSILTDTGSSQSEDNVNVIKNIAEDVLTRSQASTSNASYVVISSNSSLTNERVLTAGSNITITDGGAGGNVTISSSAGSSGDVVGPASATDNAVARFNLTTGKLIQNSGVTIDDSDNVTTAGNVAVNGGNVTTTSSIFALANAANTINIGTTAVTRDVNIGTGTSGVTVVPQTVTLGSKHNSSTTLIQGGTGDITLDADNTIVTGDLAVDGGDLTTTSSTFNLLNDASTLNIGTSNIARTINIGSDPGGTATSQQTIHIGAKNTFASAITGFNKIHIADEDSYYGHEVYILSDNGTQSAGNSILELGTVPGNSTITIGCASSGVKSVTIGCTNSTSLTTIKGGSGGIILTASGGQTVITGSSTTYTDALIGAWEIGSLPATQGTFPNAYAFVGHKDLNHSADGNYALVQSNVGDSFLGAASTKDIYFKNGTNVVGQLSNDTVSFTGQTGTAVATTLGNSFGVSYTNIIAGTFGITLSGSSTTTITGSTSTSAEAHIGTAELGELPYTKTSFPSYFAMFGHKTLDHSLSGNYALVQSYDGDTFLNAASTKSIYLQNAGNLIGTLDENTISLTGQANTAVATTIGSSYGVSTTNINAGLFGITLSGSATTTITGSSSTSAEAHIGVVEIGELPYTKTSFPSYFAMFGHKTLDHSVNGNYSLVQSYDGDTFINASSTKSIYLQNSANAIGTLNASTVSLTGQANTAVSTTLGSNFGVSLTNIYAGLFGITLSGSATTTVTGSSSTSAEAHIGTAEIGELPFTKTSSPGIYAMFGHKTLNHSVDGNYAIVQSSVGDTFVGAASAKNIYLKNGINIIGQLGTNNVSLTGAPSSSVTAVIGSVTGSSSTLIQGGTAGITFSGSGGQTVITGSSTTYTDALIGAWEIGSLPATQGTFPNVYAFLGHKSLDHGSDGNYALVQSNVGDTFLGAVATKDIFFKNGTDFVGTLSDDTVSFTGKSGTATTTTLGNTAGSSATNISAGTGGVFVTGSTTLSAGLFSFPTGSSTTCPLVLLTNEGATVHRWALGTDTGDDLNFAYGANTTTVLAKGFLQNTTNVGPIDFTGQHRNFPASGSASDYSSSVGLIVIASGQYKNLISGSSEIFINEALPTVALSTSRNQKSVFGIISDAEDSNELSRDYVAGRWVSVYEKVPGDDRLIINSLGEGAIWVCSINGDLENGDYITTCEIPGHGMKQDDDLLHNYTVAKITCDCSFDLNSSAYRCEEFEHEGITYRRAFVGCTYHCG